MAKRQTAGAPVKRAPRRRNPQFTGHGIYWDIFTKLPHDGEWYQVKKYQGEWGAKITRDRIIYTHWHKHIRVPEPGCWELTAERGEPDEDGKRGSVLYARWTGKVES